MAADNNEMIREVTGEVWKKISQKDLGSVDEKIAVQVNLTGRISGVFYIEIQNGSASVEPYEYIDRDGEISVTKTNLSKLISGKLSIDDEKVTVNGDFEKVKKLFSVFA